MNVDEIYFPDFYAVFGNSNLNASNSLVRRDLIIR